MDDSKPTRLERPSTPEHQGTTPQATSTSASVGPRYTNGDEIARGGMGRVIEATDTVLQRVVAIKEALTSEPELLKRFAREMRITARLEHPSIVPLYDAGGGDGEPPFYVMRRVSGQPLEELIGAANDLDARLALLPNLLAATQAIAHAHKRGVIHRDLKPSNILVGELGETVVIDWGLAKVIGEADDEGGMAPLAGDSLRTRIGTIAGTPGFMSPEQARGEDHGTPSDVWALGACLYFLLARQPPHHRAGSTGDDLIAYVAARPVMPIGKLVRGVPRELAAIVDKALAFGKQQRYPDAAALAEELRRFLAGQLVAAHEYTLRERVVRMIKRNRTAVGVAALAMVLLAVVSTYAIGRVIHERDIATTEREAALDAQRVAESERKNAQERADAELIARARAAAVTDPVRAAAVIGMLSPTSSRIDDARGVLRSARMHGANVMGIQGDSASPIIVEVSPRGDRAYVVRLGGLLETFAIPATGNVKSTVLAGVARARWVDGGDRILVWGETEPRLFDPATKVATPLHVGRLENVQADANGTTLVAVTVDHKVGWLDTKAGTLAPFAMVSALTRADVALTQNGELVAVGDGSRIRIFARDGRLRSTWNVPTKEGVTLAASDTSKFAAVSGSDVFIVDAAAASPAWTPLATEDPPSMSLVGLPYFDGEGLRLRGTLAMFVVTAKHRVRVLDAPSSNFALVGSAQTITLDREQHVVLWDSEHTQSFSLPGALESAVVGGRRGVPYAIIAVRGGTYVLDLRYQTPRPVDETGNGFAAFADDHTALAGSGVEVHWLDLDTGKRFPLEVNGLDSCCRPGTFIDSSSSLILYPESGVKPHKELYAFAAARTPGYQFLGDDIIGAAFGPRVAVVDLHTAHVVELGKSSIDVVTFPEGILQWSGQDDELLVASATRLVRIRVSTAKIIDERAIAANQAGVLLSFGDRIVLSHDKTISYFEHPEQPLVKVAQNIESMTGVQGGVVTMFEDQSGAYVSLGAEPHAYPLGQTVLAIAKRHIVVDTGVDLELVDVSSQMRSALPMKRHRGPSAISISQSEDRLLESGDSRPWLWTVPTFSGDLASEVRATTNAKERDGVVVWPWQ